MRGPLGHREIDAAVSEGGIESGIPTAPRAGDAALRRICVRPFEALCRFCARPIQPVGYDNGMTWPQWLVDDQQRKASGRTDVLAFVSDMLTAPMKISGQPVVNLKASTSGTDSDWVEKAIDVYPDEVAGQPKHGWLPTDGVGRHFPRTVSLESLETAKAITPGAPLLYKWTLPTANHVFLPGHRIMVQVQSSWFPLYDRNPQTFVKNIFLAKAEDYKKATQRVYTSPASWTCRWLGGDCGDGVTNRGGRSFRLLWLSRRSRSRSQVPAGW